MVIYRTSLVAQMVKKQCRRPEFDPWIRKIPWRREWQPTPVFLPEESHGAEKPGGLQSMESQTGGHDLVTKQQQQLTRQWNTLPGRKLGPHVQRPCG